MSNLNGVVFCGMIRRENVKEKREERKKEKKKLKIKVVANERLQCTRPLGARVTTPTRV